MARQLYLPILLAPIDGDERVGKKAYKGIALYLLHVFLAKNGRADEVLVFCPQMAIGVCVLMTPPNIRITAYGSSFLVGQIEEDGRPHSQSSRKPFSIPQSASSTCLSKEVLGPPRLRIASGDSNRLALYVAFDQDINGGPFATLRLMYVTEFNNNPLALLSASAGAKGWHEDNNH